MPYDTLAYAVQPGDNIDRIVAKYYGSLSQQRKRDIKTHIAETNPHILDVKHLRAGQMMVLTTPITSLLATIWIARRGLIT